MTRLEPFESPARPRTRHIPPGQMPAFRRYVLERHGRFLLAINFIAMIAYDSYALADALLIPDMAWNSLLLRGGLSLVGLLNIFLVFRYCRSVLVRDMLMPFHDIVSTVAWFELLKASSSPDVPTFLYASVVFIVLGNLGVRYSFRGIFACSMIITGVIFWNVWLLHPGNPKAVMIFALVFVPVLIFSLAISWTNIAGVRQAFLSEQEERRQREELALLNQRLQEMASTDALTRVGNRRAFDQHLDEHWQQMGRNGRPFALLMADIDYFKPYNDHYGHPAGDQCLRQVAEAMGSALRSGQAEIFRYGGEEFVVLLQVSDAQELLAIAERLRREVADLGIDHAHRPDGLDHLTISLGGGLSSAPGLAHPQDLLARCDQLLYQAKQAGRNQARLASHA